VWPILERQVSEEAFENAPPAALVGQLELEVSVEPPGTPQRIVDRVRLVRGRDNDEPVVGLEAVHLGEHLAETCRARGAADLSYQIQVL